MPKEPQSEGIYFGMPEDVYHNSEGLSCSGMKQLAISPLNYWHNNLNPDLEREDETSFQRFGKAMHCALLEPEEFDQSYACGLSQDDYEELLVTTSDLKGWMEANGLKPMSKWTKPELISRIVTSCLVYPPIWDLEVERMADLSKGKILLKQTEMRLISKARDVVLGDEYARALLSKGMPEVSFFVRDPESGVMLKARMDYVRPNATIDLKTFSNTRGKPTDKVIYDSIYYEKYHMQCVFYTRVRELTRLKLEAGELTTFGNVCEEWIKAFIENDHHGFGFIFVESSAPYDMRIVQMRQAEQAGGESNVYWLSASILIDGLIEIYTAWKAKCGESPWRESAKPHVLLDTDIPQLMFS